MALDFGHKRVGIASTDESGHFALPRVVLPNDAELLEKVIEFKTKEGIEKIILGESKNLVMEANPIRTQAEEFKQALEARGVEVVWHPEMFTTMEARQIQGNTEFTDASAAALILKSYIDLNS